MSSPIIIVSVDLVMRHRMSEKQRARKEVNSGTEPER